MGQVVCKWMLSKKNIDPNKNVGRTKHLLSIGSVLGMGDRFNATVWGSGLLHMRGFYVMSRVSRYRRFDIRAVRGPVSRDALTACGYSCPSVYGDPAILLPLIYKLEIVEKKYPVSLIVHMALDSDSYHTNAHKIDIRTDDYERFVNELCLSEKIISSSLHGIILAESYGIPTVFLYEGVENQLLKFLDWYYSTGRMNVKIAKSLEEAMEMEPMPLPDLSNMQKQIMDVFPYDLWE